MKFVILDNTAWTTHFVVLQSTSRAAETASVASRRTTERLVCWTHPTSSPPPSSLYVRAVVFDDTLRAPLQIFFAAPLRKYPYDGCGNMAHNLCTHPSMQVSPCMRRCTIVMHDVACHIFSVAETTTPAGRGRRSSPNGDRCAARANQKVSQSSASAVAAVCAGAAEAAAGLRTGAAAATRFGGASRSSRAAAWTGTATVAATARGA